MIEIHSSRKQELKIYDSISTVQAVHVRTADLRAPLKHDVQEPLVLGTGVFPTVGLSLTRPPGYRRF